MSTHTLPQVIGSTLAHNHDSVYYFLKRIMDVTVAVALLIFLSPLLLLIAIVIKLDSPGPAIYVQERVGTRRKVKGGRTDWEIRYFRFYKFRSMKKDTDSSLHREHVRALIHQAADKQNGSGLSFKLSNDPRVTRIGSILRKTSLDELPQLINVLKGDLSLVGPRPVPPYEVAEYKPWHYQRLNTLPGITGLWQVAGRGTVSFDDMINLDIQYIQKQSLGTDIKILLQTIPAVLSRRGAH